MKTMLRNTALPLAMIFALGACQRSVEVMSGGAAVGPEPVVLATASTAVPTGTLIQASLNENLSTAESEVNETFTMSLLTPILDAQQQTVIPAGARITGIVTGLRESRDVATPAVIRVDFQNITWGNRTVPIKAEVTDASPQRQGRTANDALRGAATGAAAGAVLGAIIGRDVQGAATGAAIGAGAGTLISLGTSDQQASLEAGSTMTLRLLEPVPLR
jgi:hypothetical protein